MVVCQFFNGKHWEKKKKHFMISNLKLSNVIFGLVIGYSQMRKKTRKGKGFLICTANPLQSQPCMIPDSRNRDKKIIGKKKKNIYKDWQVKELAPQSGRTLQHLRAVGFLSSWQGVNFSLSF